MKECYCGNFKNVTYSFPNCSEKDYPCTPIDAREDWYYFVYRDVQYFCFKRSFNIVDFFKLLTYGGMNI
jgi:hypothetical protein